MASRRTQGYPFYNKLDEDSISDAVEDPLRQEADYSIGTSPNRDDDLEESQYRTPIGSKTEHTDDGLLISNDSPSQDPKFYSEIPQDLRKDDENPTRSIHEKMTYSSHQKRQSAAPNQWLNDINVDHYVGQPHKPQQSVFPMNFIPGIFRKASSRESLKGVEMKESIKKEMHFLILGIETSKP